jgi:hypothetical protein
LPVVIEGKNKGKMVYVPIIKSIYVLKNNYSILKQNYGEGSSKDTLFRIKEIHAKELTPCSKAMLNMNFYFGCRSWGKRDLDLATRGSFMLLPSGEAPKVMENIFVTTTGSFQKKVDKCTNKLPS